MNKRKALRLIRERIAQVDGLPENGDNEWQARTASSISHLLRPGSVEYDRVVELANDAWYYHDTNEGKSIATLRHRSSLKNRLLRAEEYVTHFGPHAEPKPNFLAKVPDVWLGILTPLIIGGLCTLSYGAGVRSANVDSIELERENRELRDTVMYLRVIPPHKENTDQDTSGTGKGVEQPDSQSVRK